MADFSQEMGVGEAKFVRYADDFVILVKSQRAGDRVMEGVKTFLTHRLKLTVNETKSAVARTSRIDFLGFIFSGTRIIYPIRSSR